MGFLKCLSFKCHNDERSRETNFGKRIRIIKNTVYFGRVKVSYRVLELKHSIPEWWKKTRTLYCPVSGGAGAALMSFGLDFDTSGRSKEEISEIIESSKKLHYKKPMGADLKGMRITEQIKSFVELPKMLSQARAVNSNLIYLADYWEGGYFNKGDYIPRADFGGPRAFRDGIKAIHDLGGKIIIYLEAFIVSRETSKIGREKGPKWAMMNKDGKYFGYFHNMDHTYYQMWPGKSSGWSKYLADLAEQMIIEYDVDGFHLDSYGMQRGWRDNHPDHIDGLEPGEFDVRAVDMVQDFRERVRAVKAEAIVIIEGSEIEDLLAACDGAQEWSLATLSDKPWFREHNYKIFTSEFGLPSMQNILATGYNVSIGSWWLQPMPGQQMISRLKEVDISPRGNSWIEQFYTRSPIRDLWWCCNVIWANNLVQPDELDMEWLRKMAPPFPFPCDPYLASDEGKAKWKSTVKEVLYRLEQLDLDKSLTPAECLSKLIQKAQNNLLAI